MAISVRRLAILIAIVIATAIMAGVAATRVIPLDVVGDAVKTQIRMATGLDPILRGPVSISMFPAATVNFSDVVLDDHAGGGQAFAAEQLTANLRLMPLLAGHIEIADISLTKPRIAVAFDADGRTNWSSLLDILAQALKPNAKRAERVVSFSEIRINDGVIVIHGPAGGVTETIDGIEMSLAWPSIAKSFAATGYFNWHNEKVDAGLAIADFPAALAGDYSGLKFRINAEPLKAAFDGTLSYEPTLKIDGTLAADAASLRDALQWTSNRSLPAGGFDRFALKAHAGVSGGTIALSNLNAEIDGNVAEGVLTYAMTGRRMLQGTLAVEKLDLSPYVSAFRFIAENSREWDRGSFALGWFDGWDADLRMSASRVHFARVELGRTAVAANMRSGRLVVTIGESQSFNGLITGTVAVAKAETGAEIKSQMQFSNVLLEQSLGELFGIRRLEGTGNLSFSMESGGLNVQELARNLNGTAEISARQGALTGVNVEQLLHRLQRSPLSGNGDFRGGRTPFDTLNIGLRITRGTATVEDMHLDGPGIRLALAGTTSIPNRELDLTGTASLTNPSDTSAAFELPFIVQGAWDDPLMLPDAQTLIQRSRATAPLLDAMQDSKTRDAVRSAIERLMGSGSSDRISR